MKNTSFGWLWMCKKPHLRISYEWVDIPLEKRDNFLKKVLYFSEKYDIIQSRETGWSSDPGPPAAGMFPAIFF